MSGPVFGTSVGGPFLAPWMTRGPDLPTPERGRSLPWVAPFLTLRWVAPFLALRWVAPFCTPFFTRSAPPRSASTPFAALIWRDNLMASQFQTEKSQSVGLAMYANFARL